jgi:hypothetical protein
LREGNTCAHMSGPSRTNAPPSRGNRGKARLLFPSRATTPRSSSARLATRDECRRRFDSTRPGRRPWRSPRVRLAGRRAAARTLRCTTRLTFSRGVSARDSRPRLPDVRQASGLRLFRALAAARAGRGGAPRAPCSAVSAAADRAGTTSPSSSGFPTRTAEPQRVPARAASGALEWSSGHGEPFLHAHPRPGARQRLKIPYALRRAAGAGYGRRTSG